MDILRRNTDYALRLVLALAGNNGRRACSTKFLAERVSVSYNLACKLMQKLSKAGFVESAMGSRGGFRLGKKPSQIRLLDLIKTVQGPVRINKCLLGGFACPMKKGCVVRKKLAVLQEQMDAFLAGTTIEQLIKKNPKADKTMVRNKRKGAR